MQSEPFSLIRNCPNSLLIIDDHEAILEGSLHRLKRQYPNAKTMVAKDRTTAWEMIQENMPDLVIIDLSIPEEIGGVALPSIGLDLLDNTMKLLPAPNIMVLTATVNALLRVRGDLNTYAAGFCVLDKNLPLDKLAELADITMRGAVHLPTSLRSRITFEPVWLEVLHHRFERGLTDRSIAKILGVSDRTIRNYWVRIQDYLGIHDEPGVDSRTKIEIEARRLGLIG